MNKQRVRKLRSVWIAIESRGRLAGCADKKIDLLTELFLRMKSGEIYEFFKAVEQPIKKKAEGR